MLFLSGCEEDRDQGLWCRLRIEVTLPQGYEAAEWKLTPATYLTNQNTKEQFTIPEFHNGVAELTVMKGYYLMGIFVEGTLHGKKVAMYNADYNTPDTPLYLLNETETLSLRLSVTQNANQQ